MGTRALMSVFHQAVGVVKQGKEDLDNVFVAAEKYEANKNFIKAFTLYSEAAERDHAPSLCKAATYYLFSFGVVGYDKSKALQMAHRAATSGYPVAFAILGYIYTQLGPLQQEKAKHFFNMAKERRIADYAHTNDLQAKLWLGKIESDKQAALQLLLVAHAGGNVSATSALGEFYKQASQNDVAFGYLQIAAAAAHNEAMVLLGQYHEQTEGESVKKFAKAFQNYLLAAKQKYPPAQFKLGSFYYQGLGIIKDLDRALSWFIEASNDDYVPAMYFVGLLFYDNPNKRKVNGFEYALRAAQANYGLAQVLVGKMYLKGRGVQQNLDQALEWFLKATNQNIAEAAYQVGKMFEKGSPVKRDFIHAAVWYTKAGNVKSIRKLDTIVGRAIESFDTNAQAFDHFYTAYSRSVNSNKVRAAIIERFLKKFFKATGDTTSVVDDSTSIHKFQSIMETMELKYGLLEGTFKSEAFEDSKRNPAWATYYEKINEFLAEIRYIENIFLTAPLGYHVDFLKNRVEFETEETPNLVMHDGAFYMGADAIELFKETKLKLLRESCLFPSIKHYMEATRSNFEKVQEGMKFIVQQTSAAQAVSLEIESIINSINEDLDQLAELEEVTKDAFNFIRSERTKRFLEQNPWCK